MPSAVKKFSLLILLHLSIKIDILPNINNTLIHTRTSCFKNKATILSTFNFMNHSFPNERLSTYHTSEVAAVRTVDTVVDLLQNLDASSVGVQEEALFY